MAAKSKKAGKRGLLFPIAEHESEEFAREFLASPDKFMKKRGLSLANAACPPEAHAAFKRGETFAAQAKRAGIGTDAASIKRLRALAAKNFGRGYGVSMIPFGLRFRERIDVLKADITASGTGSITWLDTDADVDG